MRKRLNVTQVVVGCLALYLHVPARIELSLAVLTLAVAAHVGSKLVVVSPSYRKGCDAGLMLGCL